MHSFHSTPTKGRRTSRSSSSPNPFQPEILTWQVRLQRKFHWRTKCDGQRFTRLCGTHAGSSTAVNPSLTPFPELDVVVVVASAGRRKLHRGETPWPLCLFTVEKKPKKLHKTRPASFDVAEGKPRGETGKNADEAQIGVHCF